MKHNWEYKNWVDVLNIVNGKNQKAVENEKGLYPIYGSGGIMGYADDYLCPEETVILGRKGSINKPIYVETKFWNVDTAFGIVANKDFLNPKYLYYFCVSYDFMKHNKATTLPSLVKSDLLKISMPIPNLSIQKRIVNELDEINSMIEGRKEQLKLLDQLAQSIFYEMFGDPITNPKGWEVKKVKEIFLLKAGKAISASELYNKKIANLYPCYGGNGIRGFINKYSHEGFFNIIGRQGALCGNITMAVGKFYATEHAVVVTPKIKLESLWANFVLKELNLNQYAKGVAQPGLSVNVINEVLLPVPPLSLQNEFARKIEVIEEQKKDIEASIKELETLLASRMDYWFN